MNKLHILINSTHYSNLPTNIVLYLTIKLINKAKLNERLALTGTCLEQLTRISTMLLTIIHTPYQRIKRTIKQYKRQQIMKTE